MSGINPALVRQWRLLRLLAASSEGLALRELAGQVEVSPKTILRDLQLFQRTGFPVLEVVGSHGVKHWRLGPAGGEIPLGFTFDEALAMVLGWKSLQGLGGTLIAEAAERAFQKLRAAFNPRVLRYLDKMRDQFRDSDFGVTEYGPHAEILDQLMIAIEERRVVFIAYRSQRATEPVTYDVHPYRLQRHQGSLYLVGYKPLDDAVRTWRVDRIERADVEQMPFTVPADLDLDARFAGSLGIYEGHEDIGVLVRFRPPAARFVQEKKWHSSQRLTPQRDGSLLAELRLSSTAELKPWILGFGSAAKCWNRSPCVPNWPPSYSRCWPPTGPRPAQPQGRKNEDEHKVHAIRHGPNKGQESREHGPGPPSSVPASIFTLPRAGGSLSGDEDMHESDFHPPARGTVGRGSGRGGPENRASGPRQASQRSARLPAAAVRPAEPARPIPALVD